MQQVNSAMQQNLKKYQLALQQELQRLLKYWIENVPDAGDGFFGKIDHDDRVYPQAPKGTVLNSRILWAFSSAYNFTKNEEYKVMAQRAFNYINAYFIDKDLIITVSEDIASDDRAKKNSRLILEVYHYFYSIFSGASRADDGSDTEGRENLENIAITALEGKVLIIPIKVFLYLVFIILLFLIKLI